METSAAGRVCARGIACCYLHGTIMVQVAEVSVADNRIRVHEVTCVADAALIVNPDGARAQAQGSIVMVPSSTLLERLTVENGMMVAGNFDQYPLVTMADTPNITVELSKVPIIRLAAWGNRRLARFPPPSQTPSLR